MALSSTNRTRRSLSTRGVLVLVAIGILTAGPVGFAGDPNGVHRYKMVSSLDYTGKGQFRNYVETLFIVSQQPLSEDKVQYSLRLDERDPNVALNTSCSPLSFILERSTRRLSGYGQEMTPWAAIHNEAVKSLTKVTTDHLGKTWKQSIDLSSRDGPLPPTLKFTLTALKTRTETFGEMIAVRALSEPFFVKIVGKGSARCRMNAVYLFDPAIEDIYLSISVFEAFTDASGFDETFRHEVATYATDSNGTSVDLTGLGAEFEKFAREVGLRTKNVKVVDEVPLPLWAQSEGLFAAQAANICGALACEGAPNPVVTVCIPAARLAAMQSIGQISAVGALATSGTVAMTLGQSVPGIAAMKIAIAPAFAGWGLGTASTVAAASAGGIAIAENNSNGGGRSNRSPTTP